MDLEDCRHLDNVEDGIHQDGCNPLKFHCTEISGDVRAAKKKLFLLYVRYNSSSCWNEEIAIDIILHQSMGHSQGDHGIPALLTKFS